MRATFFLLLFALTRHLCAEDRTQNSWIRGPLVEVQDDRSVKEIDEYDGSRPIGHPAFEKLTIRKGEKADAWIVTGTVCSTNAGGSVQGAAIYAGYAGGHFQLMSMSNQKGEVLFSVSPTYDSDAKPLTATDLYVVRHPVASPSLKGAILRKYPLRETN